MIGVGVTGKYCTGKSTVSELLGERGYVQIDVDRLGHAALVSERERVIEAFGPGLRTPEGGVDRKALGRLVFADEAHLRRLESILHPAMVEMAAETVRRARDGQEVDAGGPPPGVVINAAILVRMGLHSLCDTVIYVTAPFCSILRRARERDGASIVQVVRRLRSQRDVDPQFSHPDADIHSVENHGDRDRLRDELARLLPLP